MPFIRILALLPAAIALIGCGPKEACPDPDLLDKHKADMCTMEYAPVCGCDGKTYGNECDARRHGIHVEHQGECGV